MKLASNDMGIPIAYEDMDGAVINNPSSKKIVQVKAVFIIVNVGHVKTCKEIEKILKG